MLPTLASSKRVLEPYDRVSEVPFGLVMLLTFTGSLSVAEAGREDIRAMLLGALGCNLAWGIIDGVLFLMGGLADKGKLYSALQGVRQTTDPEKAQRLIAALLPPVIAAILQPTELESIRQRLKSLSDQPRRVRAGRDEWLGALAVFVTYSFPRSL